MSEPYVLLVVDHRRVAELFRRASAAAECARRHLSVLALDGMDEEAVNRERQRLLRHLPRAVLYLHDASTVLFPFALEPLRAFTFERVTYTDLGLSPLGASPRRFGVEPDPDGEPLFELEAIPTDALVRYCLDAAEDAITGVAPVAMRSDGLRTET